jgi:hypothetical protein
MGQSELRRTANRFPALYTIRFVGGFSSHLDVAFAGMKLTKEGDLRVMTGLIVDQAHLQRIIQQIGTLGLQLVDVHRDDLSHP